MKKSKIIKLVIFVPALCLFLMVLPGISYMAVSLFYGNEDHTFDQQMHEAHKEADQILSQHGFVLHSKNVRKSCIHIQLWQCGKIFQWF